MEQKKQICLSEELGILSPNYPWLIAHDIDSEDGDTEDQIFFTTHDQISRYRCRIPELVGKCIRGCFHGWMILSKHNPDNMEWSLWNPVISRLIRLPRLIMKDDYDDDFRYCCLTSPPDDPGSILLLMRCKEPSIVFFNCKRRKRLRRWTEMSYSKQMKNITDVYGDYIDDDDDDHYLVEPTCCNGNIYAWSNVTWPPLLIQIQITVVKEKQVLINLLPLIRLAKAPGWRIPIEQYFFLKGSGTQLFTITLCVDKEEKPSDVYLFKLDMMSMVWTEIKDLKDFEFFVGMGFFELVCSSPPIASELGGGYINILGDTEEVIYSYNIKDKTISMRRLDLPFCSISVWPTMPEFRLPKCKKEDHDDHMVPVTSATSTDTATNDDETKNETCLLTNIPFGVLEMIMDFCVGIEYLNFRATCKLCHLAAPMIQWSNERLRLRTYSLVSPWLMVIDKNQGIVTFTYPMFGENTYFMKASPLLLHYHRILCSRYGWLLLHIPERCLVFFNPFTSENHKIPSLCGVESYSFSAPPTSPDCTVVAFASHRCATNVFFHRVGGEPFWYKFTLDFGGNPHYFGFPVFCGEDIYTLFNGGGLEVFRDVDDEENYSWKTVITPRTSTSAKYYQVKCDQHHLLVMVEEYGESVEVFKLNDCKREWEKIDGLGSHMIYICEASCVCMEANTPEMENKIYFPRLHSKNEKMVFYSLETCKFHTFNGRNVEQNLTNLFETKQTACLHAWIEPTWS